MSDSTGRNRPITSALAATVATSIPAGQPGLIIADRYVITARAGRGGMADVYAAEDRLLGRAVAIKIFRVDTTPGDRLRVDSEMRTLAALRNPGLVTVFDAGALPGEGADTTPYLVMELITGPTLCTLLRDGPLVAEDVARIGHELAATLAYVHANNIVHRDIKPANVLLDAQPDGIAPYAAKLADFGISRVRDSARFTTDGATVGTPNYLSPEQAQGLDVSSAGDIYSLGLVLIECLTGCVVYPGSGIDAAIARLHRRPNIPARFGSRWQRLLTAMTADDPSARPSAGEVADTLTPTSSAPTSTVEDPAGSATELLDDLPLPSTALLPPADKDGGNRRISRTSAFRATAGLIALIALIAVAATLSSGAGPTTTAPRPLYPSVSGKLGVDLTHLEGDLP